MIAAVSDGGSSFGLMNYLVGQGRANEHTNPHLVAGSSVIMRRWGSWDELCSAQGYEIAHWVDQFMTETRTRPTGAKRVFNNETGKREVVKDQTPNHVWHCSLSLHPDEGPLEDETWRAIANDFMDMMEFTDASGKAECRWVAVNHGTAKNGGDHIHIMANIVRADGTKWNRYQDFVKAQKACNTIEHKYGLRIIEAREHARGARADSAADLRAANRQGRRHTNREVLEQRVRAAAVASTSELDFLIRLRELGVKARPRFAKGRTDVVTGYSVALHPRRGERPQWYGGNKLARDLTLPRLRARWPDTPQAALQAVDAWRQAWRGAPLHRSAEAISSAQLQARATALELCRARMSGIDPMDATALADATRDMAGLLAANAHGYAEDSPERELLERAARRFGNAAQTKTRHATPTPVDDAVVLAAGLVSTASMRPGFSSGVMVALSTLRAADALADLYEQAQQTTTAQDMLQATTEAFTRLHATLPDIDAVAYKRLIAQAASDQVPVAAAGRTSMGASATDQHRRQTVRDRDTADSEMSPEQFTRIRRIAALAGPVGASSAPQSASKSRPAGPGQDRLRQQGPGRSL